MNRQVVVTLDLDGTLLAHGNKIIGGSKTIELLSDLAMKGCLIVINTGRLDHDIIAIQNMFGIRIDARVSQNGCVLNDDRTIDAKLMDKTEALTVWQYLKNVSVVRTEINTVSNRYWKTPRDPHFPKEYYDSHVMVKHFTPVLEYQPVTEFLCVGKSEDLIPIRQFVEANCHLLGAIMTSPSSLEIYTKGISKGKTIRGIYPDATIYGIGDSENDYSVFDVSDMSFCVNETADGVATYTVQSVDKALERVKEALSIK